MKTLLATLAALFFSHAALALPACTATTPKGASCGLAAEDVRPTQLAYGEIEVARRAAKIAAMDAGELDKYLKKHVVPVVIGPGGRFFATDGHHTALALARANGNRAQVIATVLDDWRTLEPSVFWKRMLLAGRFFPFDEAGAGPLPAARVPDSLFALKDDPWRSLANGLANAGGYADDAGVPYADFLWADYLRSRVSGEQIARDFDGAVAKALSLACAPEAKAMPGFGCKTSN
jgi:hypothetical protein